MNYLSSNNINAINAQYILGLKSNQGKSTNAISLVDSDFDQTLVSSMLIACKVDTRGRHHIVVGQYISKVSDFIPLIPIFEQKYRKLLHKSNCEQEFLKSLAYEFNNCCPVGDQLGVGYCIIDTESKLLQIFSAGLCLLNFLELESWPLFSSNNLKTKSYKRYSDFKFNSLPLDIESPIFWANKFIASHIEDGIDLSTYNNIQNFLLNCNFELNEKCFLCKIDISDFIDHKLTTNDSIYLRSSSPYVFNLKLESDLLKIWDPIPLLLDSICQYNLIEENRRSIYTVLSELFSNSLDHGLLNLNSADRIGIDNIESYYKDRNTRLLNLINASIVINIEIYNNSSYLDLIITIEDTGNGFDLNNIKPKNIYSGRGVGLVRSLCNDLIYSKNGRKATAILSFNSSNN